MASRVFGKGVHIGRLKGINFPATYHADLTTPLPEPYRIERSVLFFDRTFSALELVDLDFATIADVHQLDGGHIKLGLNQLHRISGTGPKTVLLRGIGPSLATYGVYGVLADPEIILHDSSGEVIARNDNWSANLGSAFEAVGAFELVTGSLDAAMVLPLWPVLHTIHLQGADEGSGQGLIEIYDLDL